MPKKTPKTTKKSETKVTTPTSTVAKSTDGTIQITFTIPYKTIDEKRQLVLTEIGKEIEVPGFRKGKAPVAKVAEHVKQDTVIQRTLNTILPKLLGEAITREKLHPAIYPRFELVKMVDGEPWQIRAITCELPVVELGDYKKAITDAAKAGSIWTPEKGDPTKKEETKEPTKADKEQQVIKILLEKVKVTIPKLLTDEEVNNRLSQLLARIENLGLDIDSYLASIGKNAQTIRTEYETQANQSIALDLILTEIAKQEKIVVDSKHIDAAIEATKADPNVKTDADKDQQRALIDSILKRRQALDSLINLL